MSGAFSFSFKHRTALQSIISLLFVSFIFPFYLSYPLVALILYSPVHVFFIILLVLLLLYLALILRSGSSFWIERRLKAQGIRSSTPWTIPLYGAVFGADPLVMESLLPKDENQKVKYFTNLGLVYVPISTFENAVAVWDVISSNEEKVLLAYSAVEILTFGPSLVSANGYAWKHPRAVLTKAFRKEAMLNVQTVIRKLTD